MDQFYRFSIVVLVAVNFITSAVTAQDSLPKQLDVNGYVSYLQSGILGDEWIINNQAHNRLNLDYYINPEITLHSSFRTRLLYGNYNRMIPNYADGFELDPGYADMTFVPLSDSSYVVAMQADRLYGEWNKGKLQLSIGRQRINWGQCTVWNPNDVLNTYSYFDFDYVERPGSDAVRVTYFRNYASQLELVAKASAGGVMSYAGLYKFNKWNYDIQFFGAFLNEKELAGGIGTMGYIGANSVRAEYTILQSEDAYKTGQPVSLLAFGMDRLCKKDLFIQGEALYNSYADKISPDQLTGVYSQPASIRELSFDRYSIFGAAQYPLTPLLNVSFSGMYYARSNAYFISPNISISLKENLDISFIGQYFNLLVDGNRDGYASIFWSLKQSF